MLLIATFWMSSTQWGKVETVGDEGAVSGYTCGAWATACALLRACGGGGVKVHKSLISATCKQQGGVLTEVGTCGYTATRVPTAPTLCSAGPTDT